MAIAEAIYGAFSGIVKPILDKWIPDAKDRLEAEQTIMKAAFAIDLAQIGVNTAEAANPNVFVSGWRPFIGWTCGSAFAWQFVGEPVVTYVLLVSGVHVPPIPQLDWSQMSVVLTGMLGLGAMRSYDKQQGTSK
jgi:hypothetical protein